MATVDDKKVIFSMVGVSKTIQQNQKQVLKNIYLSFFYGAKIGIIGLNGAGKSTLMKIIAGLDQQYQGNVVWSPGRRTRPAVSGQRRLEPRLHRRLSASGSPAQRREDSEGECDGGRTACVRRFGRI